MTRTERVCTIEVGGILITVMERNMFRLFESVRKKATVRFLDVTDLNATLKALGFGELTEN